MHLIISLAFCCCVSRSTGNLCVDHNSMQPLHFAQKWRIFSNSLWNRSILTYWSCLLAASLRLSGDRFQSSYYIGNKATLHVSTTHLEMSTAVILVKYFNEESYWAAVAVVEWGCNMHQPYLLGVYVYLCISVSQNSKDSATWNLSPTLSVRSYIFNIFNGSY